METTAPNVERDALRAWGVSIAQATCGAYFFVAGVLALNSAPEVVRGFARWGWPDEARVAVGLFELVASVLIVVPRFARRAAITLGAMMVASMLVRVAKLELFPGLIEGILLVPLLILVANAHRPARAVEVAIVPA